MRSFEYGDEKIGYKETWIAVASMVIGVGILMLPRTVATGTEAMDGLVSILMGGVFFMVFAWLTGKVASRYPGETLYTFASKIVTKPVAAVLTVLLAVQFLLTVSVEIRTLGNITKLYMFDRTPIEVVVFVFLLVIIYGVMGSTTALLRLNLMFFPIVITVTLLVQVMNVGLFEAENIRPILNTPWKNIVGVAYETGFSYLGFLILLFYVALMKDPKKAPKAAVVGMSIPLFLYMIIYLFCIGVFSRLGTAQIMYPTIEIAKEVEVPGEFFERFESVFFTTWIMTIFNTSAMAYNVSIIAIRSLCKKINKNTIIYILSPIIYVIAMLPQNPDEIILFGSFMGQSGLAISVAVPSVLLIISTWRRGK